MDMTEVEKLLEEAMTGLATAKAALATLQTTVDKLDDFIPDVGPGQYLHMVRVAVDLFEDTLAKVQLT